MPRTTDIKHNFSTGEISPYLLGRTDLAKYNGACESLVNFICRVQGGVTRRPGLRYIFDLEKPGRLIPFSSDSFNSFILIFQDKQLFVYRVSNGDTTTLTTPYSYSDNLELLKYVRIGNIMYLVHPLYPVGKLSKVSNSDWIFSQPKFSTPPATQQDEDISNGTIDIDGFGKLTYTGTSVVSAGDTTWLFTPSDIGKVIAAGSGGGEATITALYDPHFIIESGIVKARYVQANITSTFDATEYSSWTLNGTPHTEPISFSNAHTGDKYIAFSGPVLMKGDIGRQIVAGTGIAIITDVLGSTTINSLGATLYDTATYEIIDGFDQSSYTATNWFIRGSPGSFFSPGDTGSQVKDDGDGRHYSWYGQDQFGSGSKIPVRSTTEHPTDYSFQESTGSSYEHIYYPPVGTSFQPFMDTFRESDKGRFVSFSGGYGHIHEVVNSTKVIVHIHAPPTESETDANGKLQIAVGIPGAWYYEYAAFDAFKGYPNAIAFFQDRLWLAGTKDNPQTIWASQTDDYENFAKGKLDDDGIEITLASGDVDTILWIQPYVGNIVAGTFRGEHIIGGSGTAAVGQNSTAITPNNIGVTFQSAYGVTSVQPVNIQEALFYIQRSQFNVYQMEFNIQSAIYSSKDLNLLNEIVTPTPFIEMVYQQNPYKVVWFIASEPNNIAVGKNLVGLTYDRDQDIFAWHRHFSGRNEDDSFISAACVPSLVNNAIIDQMYFVMKRNLLTAHGTRTAYSLEVMDDSLYVDYGYRTIITDPNITYLSGSDVAYLETQPIIVVANLTILPEDRFATVYNFPPGFKILDAGGSIDAQIGFNFTSSLITVRPEEGGARTTQGILKRWNRIWIRVYNSLGLSVNHQYIPTRTPETPLDSDEGTPLFTGDIDIINLGYDRDGRVLIEQTKPLPANVLAMFGQLIIGEN